MMIIYIHGFGGSGKGVKATLFKEAFSSEHVIAPSLSYVPDLAVTTLCELIESYLELGVTISLIGSSLGGFYALYLSDKYDLKAVLLNPSLYPYKTLSSYVGEGLNFYDQSCFEWSGTHIKMLKQYEVNTVKVEKILLLQQKGDVVVDYKEAQQKLQGVVSVLDAEGSHSFEAISEHFERIKSFLRVRKMMGDVESIENLKESVELIEVELMLTPDELKRYATFCSKHNLKFNDWIRSLAHKALQE